MNEFIDILHVDDDQLYHELVRHVLEKEIGGSRVSEAASYPEFEARLAEGNYDLVLTDFNIFGLEGSQVFDAVRVVDPQAPVVIVTGPGSEGMAVEAVERGATDYVTKTPQSLRWLPHAVRAAIEQQRLQAEHKRAEEALHQSEQRFRQVVASISDHIYVTEVAEDRRHVNLYISPYVEALTGYPWEKFLADWSFWPSAVIHPDDRAAAAAQVSRLAKGQDSQMEYRLIRANGDIVWVRDSGRVEKDSTRQRLIIYGVVSDITERKQAEAVLWQSMRRFRALIENASDVIVILDDQGKFRYSSPSTLKILGYLSEDMIGRSILEFVHPNDVPLVTETIEKALQYPGVNIPAIEHCIWHKNGSWHTLVSTITNLLDDPAVNGLVVNSYDITEHKKLEEQFYQSQKMEAIGRLAGGVAHDFNNILQVIIGYSTLLLDHHRDEQDPLRQDVEQIKKAGERATGLIRQLLAFSRQQVLQLQVLNLNLAVADMAKMLRRLIGEDIDLNIGLEPDLGRVKADPGQIEQIILNLAINARDAMPQGGKLTIETANVVLDEAYARWHAEVKPGPYVMLAVSDTGIGIDKETQSRLFEPFFTTKEQSQGTGLGLATVYGIVKQSGGDIWVYSEPGQGATFKIYLPRAEETVETPQPNPARTELPSGWETVLLVEDEGSVRELIRTLLQSNGYTVLEASNGGEALLVCQQHPGPIHLLITDVVMPQMGGLELAERLALLRPGLKALYMSGYTNQAIVHHGVLEPGLSFLQKPFTPAALRRKVREILDAPLI